jgi:transglutaminase-like putative cysteine protease
MSYPALFHGASEWTRMPFWLQGATIGALFIIPVALLLEIVTGLSRMARQKISDLVLKAAVLGMSLVITLGAVRVPAASDSEKNSGSTRASSSVLSTNDNDQQLQGEAGYQQARAQLDHLYAALDVLNSKTDRSLFDVDALAARLGSDPAAIFHFVRDNIRYEPYTGVLRGALGTLLCGAGNSLDRSLLLAALLQKAGFTTQIASGQLTAQQAQTLVNRLFEPLKPAPSAIPSLEVLAPGVSRALGITPTKFLQVANAGEQKGEQQKKDLISYADSETSVLSNLLIKAGVDAGVVTSDDQLVAESRDHYWVQYQNSSGQWVDLDPSFADAQPGKAVAHVADTFAINSVPEELYHHLKITLTLRTAQLSDGSHGATTDTVLLTRELRVAEQQGKDIILANVPQPTPNFLKPAASLSSSLASVKGYQTVLQIGTQVTAGKYFDLDGKIANRLPGAEGEVASNAGGLGAAFGALGRGSSSVLGGSSPQGPATRIVGEWVDYKLTSPTPNGGQPSIRSYHRDIVVPLTIKSWTAGKGAETVPARLTKDVLRRRLLWMVELSPVSGALPSDYAGYLQMQALIGSRELVSFLSKIASGLSPQESLPSAPRLPVASTILSAETMQMASTFDSSRFSGLRTYFSEPGLIAYEQAETDSSTGVDIKQGYDIIAYRPRVASLASDSDSAHKAAGSLHIMQGVLATRLEWALLANARAGQDLNVMNATTVFAAARKQGIATIILRPGAAGLMQLATLSIANSIKAELSENLGRGYILALPTSAPKVDGRSELGWWRFDGNSGELVGVLPGGRGQAMTTESILAVTGLAIGGLMCGYIGHQSGSYLGCVVPAGIFGGFLLGLPGALLATIAFLSRVLVSERAE